MGFSKQEYWSGLPFASPGGRDVHKKPIRAVKEHRKPREECASLGTTPSPPRGVARSSQRGCGFFQELRGGPWAGDQATRHEAGRLGSVDQIKGMLASCL